MDLAPTNVTVQDEEFEVISSELRICLKIFLSMVAICGILGNSLTLLAVGTNRKLWTAPNSFVFNLAIPDLYVCLVHIPVSLAYDLSPPPRVLCSVMGYFTVVCQIGSIAILCLIAVNRYMFICRSRDTYQKIYTFGRTLTLNLGVWVLVSVILSPPWFGWGEYGWNYDFGTCNFVKSTETFWFIIALPDSVVMFPTIVITGVCYVKIMLTFHRSHKKTTPDRRQTSVQSETGTTSSESTNKVTENLRKKRIWKMRAVLLNMFLMWALFLLCWGPVVATYKIDGGSKVSPSVYHVLFTLAITNSMVNFLLYAAFNRNYRQAYIKLICWKSNNMVDG